MYRKIAMASVTLNVVLVALVLFALVPWLMGVLAPLKIEMPTSIGWLVGAHNFLTSLPNILVLLSLLLIGFIATTLRKKEKPLS